MNLRTTYGRDSLSLESRMNLLVKREALTKNIKTQQKIIKEQGVADAHPYGERPFKRKNYINKFLTLTENILNKKESERFLKVVQNLKKLKSGQLDKLNLEVKKNKIKRNFKKGIF